MDHTAQQQPNGGDTIVRQYDQGVVQLTLICSVSMLGKHLSVDANLGQHTRALERASRKWTEERQGHTDRLDRLSKPVKPISRVSLESVVSRDKYHTYVVKSGKVYEQTGKG